MKLINFKLKSTILIFIIIIGCLFNISSERKIRRTNKEGETPIHRQARSLSDSFLAMIGLSAADKTTPIPQPSAEESRQQSIIRFKIEEYHKKQHNSKNSPIQPTFPLGTSPIQQHRKPDINAQIFLDNTTDEEMRQIQLDKAYYEEKEKYENPSEELLNKYMLYGSEQTLWRHVYDGLIPNNGGIHSGYRMATDEEVNELRLLRKHYQIPNCRWIWSPTYNSLREYFEECNSNNFIQNYNLRENLTAYQNYQKEIKEICRKSYAQIVPPAFCWKSISKKCNYEHVTRCGPLACARTNMTCAKEVGTLVLNVVMMIGKILSFILIADTAVASFIADSLAFLKKYLLDVMKAVKKYYTTIRKFYGITDSVTTEQATRMKYRYDYMVKMEYQKHLFGKIRDPSVNYPSAPDEVTIMCETEYHEYHAETVKMTQITNWEKFKMLFKNIDMTKKKASDFADHVLGTHYETGSTVNDLKTLIRGNLKAKINSALGLAGTLQLDPLGILGVVQAFMAHDMCLPIDLQ